MSFGFQFPLVFLIFEPRVMSCCMRLAFLPLNSIVYPTRVVCTPEVPRLVFEVTVFCRRTVIWVIKENSPKLGGICKIGPRHLFCQGKATLFALLTNRSSQTQTHSIHTSQLETMTETAEQRAQNAKFGYKAPESVYQKHDPKSTLVGSGT